MESAAGYWHGCCLGCSLCTAILFTISYACTLNSYRQKFGKYFINSIISSNFCLSAIDALTQTLTRWPSLTKDHHLLMILKNFTSKWTDFFHCSLVQSKVTSWMAGVLDMCFLLFRVQLWNSSPSGWALYLCGFALYAFQCWKCFTVRRFAKPWTIEFCSQTYLSWKKTH